MGIVAWVSRFVRALGYQNEFLRNTPPDYESDAPKSF
jgi:hypothetical protein